MLCRSIGLVKMERKFCVIFDCNEGKIILTLWWKIKIFSSLKSEVWKIESEKKI